ncbi:GntR family transcriptional regulator [Photobacterium sp. 2_MG-2023]|uniref:GntR family transcriptional regulator n=1 Tax=Photobacterium sp. 2_MG-2023 TaxID=3062663 RepID=UPI0026E3FD22|nr:GntR family transcriptional regulator [Photobacterium sp. 2_MG-2023]MDO6580943.1 GntR family transcriptional regulator [Photobacterium sp. 2_MG-2023]
MLPVELTELYIKECIISGKYQAGSSLPSERKLADIIGVNRSTLRIALKALHSEGWILMQHGKSTIVRSFCDDGTLVTAISRVAVKNDDFSKKIYSDTLQVINDLKGVNNTSGGLVIILLFNELYRIANTFEGK